MQIYDCNGTGAQNWTLYPDYTVRKYGKCLDIAGNQTVNNTLVDLYTCNGQPNQVWELVSQTNELWNPNSDRCLDDPSGNLTNGTQLQIYDCNNGPHQNWTAAANPIAPIIGPITNSANTGLCLTDNGTGAAGEQVQLATCASGAKNQQWSINPNGSVTVAGTGSGDNGNGTCLDITGAGTTAGTKVEVWPCAGSGNEQWQTHTTTTTFWNSISALCLDTTPSGNTTTGVQLQINTCNSSTATQTWNIP